MGNEKMIWRLNALGALSEDLNFIRRLTTTFPSSSRGFNALFGLPQALAHVWQAHIVKHRHKQKYLFFKYVRMMLNSVDTGRLPHTVRW